MQPARTFNYLSAKIRYGKAPYGSFGLDAELRLKGPATRPDVFLQVSPHQLYIEQTGGIDEHRSSEYSALFA